MQTNYEFKPPFPALLISVWKCIFRQSSLDTVTVNVMALTRPIIAVAYCSDVLLVFACVKYSIMTIRLTVLRLCWISDTVLIFVLNFCSAVAIVFY